MTKSVLLMKMVEVLQNQPGVPIYELARVLNRSERTVYRWLSELSENPKISVYSKDGCYYIRNYDDAPSVSFNQQELLALHLSLKSGLFGHDSPIKEYADSAWLKVRNAASSEAMNAVRNLLSTHSVKIETDGMHLPPGLAKTLERGITEHCQLHILYNSQKSDYIEEYTIDPYALVFRKHSWYLLARSKEHRKVVQFKLVLLLSAEDTGLRFSPPDFSVQDYFRWSWDVWGGGEPLTVRIRFSPAVARMIAESKMHPTQQNFPQYDGSIIMEVSVSNLQEIATWVMGYGKDAEVLEPRRLRDDIRDHVKRMADLYERPVEPAERLFDKQSVLTAVP